MNTDALIGTRLHCPWWTHFVFQKKDLVLKKFIGFVHGVSLESPKPYKLGKTRRGLAREFIKHFVIKLDNRIYIYYPKNMYIINLYNMHELRHDYFRKPLNIEKN